MLFLPFHFLAVLFSTLFLYVPGPLHFCFFLHLCVLFMFIVFYNALTYVTSFEKKKTSASFPDGGVGGLPLPPMLMMVLLVPFICWWWLPLHPVLLAVVALASLGGGAAFGGGGGCPCLFFGVVLASFSVVGGCPCPFGGDAPLGGSVCP